MNRIEEIKRFSELRNKFASNQLDTHGKIEFDNLCEKLDPINIVGTLLEQLDKCFIELKMTGSNLELCQDHAQGNDVPFCTNQCETKRRAIATLRDLFGEDE